MGVGALNLKEKFTKDTQDRLIYMKKINSILEIANYSPQSWGLGNISL